MFFMRSAEFSVEGGVSVNERVLEVPGQVFAFN